MLSHKQVVEDFFDRNNYWQGEVYADVHHPFSRAIARRKEYAFEMLNRVPGLVRGVALDIGCGNATYVPDLVRMGFEVYGVDISREMLRKAAGLLQESGLKSRVRLLRGDVENLPFEDGRFDLIVCMGVLDYLPRDYRALSELRRLTKPGGILIVNISNYWNLTDLDFHLRKRIRSLWDGREDRTLRPTQPHTVPAEWGRNDGGDSFSQEDLQHPRVRATSGMFRFRPDRCTDISFSISASSQKQNHA